MSKYELTLLALIVNNMFHFMTSQRNIMAITIIDMVAFNNMLPMLLLSHNPPHYVCSTTENQIAPCEFIPMHQFTMLQSVEQSGKLNTFSMFLPHYDPLTTGCNNDSLILVT
jgi:hypothetical protein